MSFSEFTFILCDIFRIRINAGVSTNHIIVVKHLLPDGRSICPSNKVLHSSTTEKAQLFKAYLFIYIKYMKLPMKQKRTIYHWYGRFLMKYKKPTL